MAKKSSSESRLGFSRLISTTSGRAASTCAMREPFGSITTRSSSPASRRPSDMIAARLVLVSMMAIRIRDNYAALQHNATLMFGPPCSGPGWQPNAARGQAPRPRYMLRGGVDGRRLERCEIDPYRRGLFDMLADELAGKPLNKAEHNRSLQRFISRSRSSIEFKHQISRGSAGAGSAMDRWLQTCLNFRRRCSTERCAGSTHDPIGLHLLPAMIAPSRRHGSTPPSGLARRRHNATSRQLSIPTSWPPSAANMMSPNVTHAIGPWVWRGRRLSWRTSGRCCGMPDAESLRRTVRWTAGRTATGRLDIASFETNGRSRF